MAEFLYPSMVSYVADAGGLDESVTTVTLVDTTLFPDAGDYRVIIDAEIMLVASHAVGVLTVTRAQEGTVATGHAPNAGVFLVWTAGGMNAWKAS